MSRISSLEGADKPASGRSDIHHTRRLNSPSFFIDGMFARRPQIDNRLHAQPGQTAPAGVNGLATPVQVRVHRMKIWNARRFNIGRFRRKHK